MIWWVLMAGVPLDPLGDPLPRYVMPEHVAAVLDDVKPRLAECQISGDSTVRVELDFMGDGTIKVVRVDGGGTALSACWADALESQSGHKHDDVPQRVSTTIYVRDGSIVLSPSVLHEQRDVFPLLLFVTEGARSAVNSAIRGAGEPEQ